MDFCFYLFICLNLLFIYFYCVALRLLLENVAVVLCNRQQSFLSQSFRQLPIFILSFYAN
jgi:hypothetical protein